jgi:hypothetical protein
MSVLDQEAVAQSRQLLETHLAAIDLSGLEPRGTPTPSVEGAAPHATAYEDALVDLRYLLDEIRFSTALASLLIWDFRFKVERGEATENDPFSDLISSFEARPGLASDVPDLISKMPMPSPVLTFLAVYGDDALPSADRLFTHPTEHFGFRTLGPWFGGQLLDSALFRSFGALDRIIALLWCRARRPLHERSDGSPMLPTFGPAAMKELRSCGAYPEAGLAQLEAIQEHELFQASRALRDGFTHRRRGHFEAGGERLTSYEQDGERIVVQGGSLEGHINLAVGCYAVLLQPAVSATRQLLASSEAP